MNNKKLFNAAKSSKKTKSLKRGRQRIGGRGRQAGSKQAGSKRAGQGSTGHKEDITKDNKPAGDKGKTDTI